MKIRGRGAGGGGGGEGGEEEEEGYKYWGTRGVEGGRRTRRRKMSSRVDELIGQRGNWRKGNDNGTGTFVSRNKCGTTPGRQKTRSNEAVDRSRSMTLWTRKCARRPSTRGENELRKSP